MAEKTAEEIKALYKYYSEELYGGVRREQNEDISFYDDTFPIPEIKEPHRPLRSGLARRIIDSPAEQMVTRNPQAFVECKNEETTNRLSKVFNHWIDILRRQNPNPFKASVKNCLLLGETYIYLVHNEDAFTKDIKLAFPIQFVMPDPITVYGSVEEDENGIPEQVFVGGDRNLSDIQFLYPKWSNPENITDPTSRRKVKWMAYYNKDRRRFEADGEAVLTGGTQKNVYGFTPFIRRYSGFGRRDADNNLKNLIVGELRGTRGLLREECLARSDMSSALHLYANPRLTLIVPKGEGIKAEELQDAYSFEAGTLSVLFLPPESKFDKENQLTPVPEAFTHLTKLQQDILQRHPVVLSGLAVTNSGRQDDLMSTTMMHKYESIIENTETMFATAFEKAIEICRKLKYVPEGLVKDDLNKDFRVYFSLKADDPLEKSYMATLGDRLWAGGQGSIDLTTYHTKYLGYTQAESDGIIAKILVDKLMLQSPDVATFLGMKYAEEAGLKDEIEKAQMYRATQGQQQEALQKAPPPSGEQRIKGETMTQQGFEMIDQSIQHKPLRKPPVNYSRNQ